MLTLNRLDCFKDYKTYIRSLNHILDLAWPRLMKLTLEQQYMLSVLLRASAGMVLTLKLEYSISSIRRVKSQTCRGFLTIEGRRWCGIFPIRRWSWQKLRGKEVDGGVLEQTSLEQVRRQAAMRHRSHDDWQLQSEVVCTRDVQGHLQGERGNGMEEELLWWSQRQCGLQYEFQLPVSS